MLSKCGLYGRYVLAVHLDEIGERPDNCRTVELRIVQTSQDSLSADAQSGAFLVQLLQHLQFGLALSQGPLIRAEVAIDLLQFLLCIGQFVLAVIQFIPAGLYSCLGQFKLLLRVRDQISKLTLGRFCLRQLSLQEFQSRFTGFLLIQSTGEIAAERGDLAFPLLGSDVENLERIARRPVAAIGVDSLVFAVPGAVALLW